MTSGSSDWTWDEPDPDRFIPDREGKFDYSYETNTQTRYQARRNTQWLSRGIVTTQEGEEYRFDFGREFEETYRFSSEEAHVRKGHIDTRKRIDPLVISLNGQDPDMVSSWFSFDLDADGTEEQIHMMAPGSGFLGLDKNGDGEINNGKELFGPSMGNGFRELLTYDTDENWWIDENDEVFARLRFWENDGQGNMVLKTLKQAGIGAICLGSFNTRQDLKDPDGVVKAVVKNAGVALREDGSVSAVQEIDWVV